jgi:hypothetical protein
VTCTWIATPTSAEKVQYQFEGRVYGVRNATWKGVAEGLIEYESYRIENTPCERAETWQNATVEYICNETGHHSNSCPWRSMADGTERRAVELRRKRNEGDLQAK